MVAIGFVSVIANMANNFVLRVNEKRGTFITGMTILLVCTSHYILNWFMESPCILSNKGRPFNHLQLAEWLCTTPLMIHLVCLLTVDPDVDWIFYSKIQVVNMVQLIIGSVAIYSTNVILATLAASIAGFAHLWVLKCLNRLTSSFQRHFPKCRHYWLLRALNVSSWFFFPMAYVFGALNFISPTTETMLYSLADLYAKIVISKTLVVYGSEQDNELEILQRIITEQNHAKANTSMLMRYIFHEVRVPLNTISLGLADINDRKTFDEEIVTTMAHSAKAMSMILNDFLSLEKLKAGKLQISMETVEVHSILAIAKKRFGPVALMTEISFTVGVQESLPPIKCDPQRMTQVISNFLSNAFKFTPKHGTVLLRARKETCERGSEWLRIDVQDTGIGLSDKDQQKLFKPFAQIESTISATAGTGLGLAISKGLMELMGGRTSIESKVGFGSIFSVLLPYPSVPKDAKTRIRRVDKTADTIMKLDTKKSPRLESRKRERGEKVTTMRKRVSRFRKNRN